MEITEQQWNDLVRRVEAAERKAADAETKASNAETKATTAETKATTAETKATNAETKATNAETKATNAETKATSSDTKAEAATKAANATGGHARVTADAQAQNVLKFNEMGIPYIYTKAPAPPKSPDGGKALPELPAPTSPLMYPEMSDDAKPGFNLGTVDDEFVWIGRDSSHVTVSDHREIVGGNQAVHVNQNRTSGVGGNDSLRVVGNSTTKIDGDANITIEGKKEEKINGPSDLVKFDISKEFTVGAKASYSASISTGITVGASVTKELSAKASLTVGVSTSSTRGYHHSRSSKDKRDDISGRYTVKVKKRCSLLSDLQILLEVGSSQVWLSDTKIILEADDIVLKARKGISGEGKSIDMKSTSADITMRAAGKVEIPKGEVSDKNFVSSG